ncbi:DUF3080 family protein [Gilvimarinus sp. SDUM040013]|uniref:DUF3080 family protein n=1 Tax=Gilvimarinus gilvus TaxID=3058038 RepID=A0ABU4RVT0_9GAMM|nr:DUF3080 family protein [Gilvimarinus sp. SDUM040013]MDO3385001.1 DUF3080 family protein [Gilvimarinus sp. SDUM040013]MDX6848376.1 DUF3080 family protein [Gilvimarinus sp. SDUM040013]
MTRTPAYIFCIPLFWFSLYALVGCTKTEPEVTFDDYLTRLGRVTDISVPPTAPHSRPQYPARAKLLPVIESPTINWLELWDYRQCGLSTLLGERNSVLGKHMQASTHFVMDVEIIQALQYCRTQTADTESQKLSDTLLNIKREQLPLRFAKATAASEEMQSFWSYSGPTLIAPQTSLNASIEAIDHWQLSMREAPLTLPDISLLENSNKVLRQKQGGTLLKSLIFAEQKMRSANRILAQAEQRKTLCPLGLAKQELNWARNVMRKFFITKVQPYLARINADNLALQASYNQFYQRLPNSTQQVLIPFTEQWHTLSKAFTLSTKAHVKHWQSLFASCGESATKESP